uniref:Uncharacterized protein n=1 Tax=Rhizophora mucronata TaxID=61149 RepID=A0A2P2R0P2_RHIMU
MLLVRLNIDMHITLCRMSFQNRCGNDTITRGRHVRALHHRH